MSDTRKGSTKLSGDYAKDDRKGTIDEVSKVSKDDVKTRLLDLAWDKPEGNLFTDQAASGTEVA